MIDEIHHVPVTGDDMLVIGLCVVHYLPGRHGPPDPVLEIGFIPLVCGRRLFLFGFQPGFKVGDNVGPSGFKILFDPEKILRSGRQNRIFAGRV